MTQIQNLLVAWETSSVTVDVMNCMIDNFVSMRELYFPPVFDAFFSSTNRRPTRIGYVKALNVRPIRDTEKYGMFVDVDIQDLRIADKLSFGDLVARAAIHLGDWHDRLDYVAVVPSRETMYP